MRSAGCAINDVADRDFDKHVRRTAARPVTSGLIRPVEALLVAAVLAMLAGLLIVRLNHLTWLLGVIALAIAASYPFTKRFFALPQAYLGIAFGFGIPMAFAAVTAGVPAVAWLMLGSNIFWAIAYDTEYAMVDRDDDLRIGIRTAAITFGRADVSAVMICYLLTLVGLFFSGRMVGARTLLRSWSLRRCHACRLSLLADSRSLARELFQGVPAEQLVRRHHLCPDWPLDYLS